MSERARRKGLNRNSRRSERPWLPKFVLDEAGMVPTAGGVEEATRRLQDLFGASPSEGGKIRCDHATLSSMPCLKRLHHRAKVFAQAGRMTGSDGQTPHGVFNI